MGRVSLRLLIVAAVTLSACSAKHHAPPLAVPQVEPGRVSVRSIAADPLGSVQPVAVAVTNGLTESIHIGGVVFGAITGALAGGGGNASQGDVRGFTERSLPDISLAPGLSTTGYVYYPEGSYQTMELQLIDEPSGRVMPERVPIASNE
jgi:hypothetical protein